MSDGLREALEKLADELGGRSSSAGAAVMVSGQVLRDLLAAHPVEPAGESTANEDEWKCAHCGDTIDLYGDDLQWRSTGDFGDTGSGAGTSARWCEDGPNHEHSPVRGIAEGGGITDEAVEAGAQAYWEARRAENDGGPQGQTHAWMRAALEAALPLLGLQQVPSREEIAEALDSRLATDSRSQLDALVDAVLALFSKPAEEGS